MAKQRKVLLILWIITLAFRVWYALAYLNYGNDTFAQQFAAENFLSGKGITLSKINGFDFTHIQYISLKDWPFTLTILQAGFYSVVKDWLLMSQLLTVASVVLFLLAAYKTMQRIQFPFLHQVFFILTLLFNPLLYADFGVSDWLALAAFSWSFYAFVTLVKKQDLAAGTIISYSFLFYLPAAFRYQYYPVVLIFPLVYYFFNWYNNKSKAKKKALQVMLLTAVLLLTQVIVFYFHSSGDAFLPDRPKGFSPENLLRSDAFLFKTFFRLDYILYSFPGHLTVMMPLLAVVNLLVFIGITVYLVRSFWLSVGQRKFDDRQVITVAILCFCWALYLFFAVMSLQYKLQEYPFITFTYVGEARYYAPLMYLLLFGLLLVLKEAGSSKIVTFLFTAVIVFNGLLFTKFLYNTATANRPVFAFTSMVADRQQAKRNINLLLKDASRPVVIAWYPASYLVLNQYKNETFILRNYKDVFSLPGQPVKPFYLVFSIEKRVQTSEQAFYFQQKHFTVAYEDHFRVVYFKEVQ